MKRLCAPILVTAMLALVGLNQESRADKVYKTVDENGKVTFSDNPGTKKGVEVNATIKNIQPSFSLPTDEDKPKEADEGEKNKNQDYAISLKSPNEGQQIGPAQKSIHVSVSLNRKLNSDTLIQYYFNGSAYRGATRAQGISIPASIKARGKNTVSASVVSPNGKVLASSNAVSVWVIKPTHN
ncbi:MAG: hypothetical protein ACI9Y1_001172 [Lentisphaeria bacterium]|jgi:hypothetical protein